MNFSENALDYKVVLLDWKSYKKSFSGRLDEILPQKLILKFEDFQFLTALTQKFLQAIIKSFDYGF